MDATFRKLNLFLFSCRGAWRHLLTWVGSNSCCQSSARWLETDQVFETLLSVRNVVDKTVRITHSWLVRYGFAPFGVTYTAHVVQNPNTVISFCSQTIMWMRCLCYEKVSLFVLFTNYYYGDQIRSDEMGRTYRMLTDENVFLQMRIIICAMHLSHMKLL